MTESIPPSAILLIHCPDRNGLIATITQFILANNGNIIHLEQHVDHQTNTFFMRIEWSLDSFWIPAEHIEEKFAPVVDQLNLTWDLRFSNMKHRMGIFVSRKSHCLHEILAKQSSKEWDVEIPVIISNHPNLKPLADQAGISYHHVPVTAENKSDAEAQQLAILREHDIDLVVLARYMQVLSNDFITHYPNQIINIHHSFLPAFMGARPYHAAYERGVKIIGATSHYVTADLDAGPIIVQDVAHITHKESVRDMIRLGRDLEKSVLSRGVWNHLQHKVLSYNNKTVVFS